MFDQSAFELENTRLYTRKQKRKRFTANAADEMSAVRHWLCEHAESIPHSLRRIVSVLIPQFRSVALDDTDAQFVAAIGAGERIVVEELVSDGQHIDVAQAAASIGRT